MPEQTIGELLLELRLDTSQMDAQFAQVQRDAISQGKKLEKDLGKMRLSGLTPTVDARQLNKLEAQLHGLNDLWDKKHRHFSKPLKPTFDPSGLNAMEAQLDRISAKQKAIIDQASGTTRAVAKGSSKSQASPAPSRAPKTLEKSVEGAAATLRQIRRSNQQIADNTAKGSFTRQLIQAVITGAAEQLGASLFGKFGSLLGFDAAQTVTSPQIESRLDKLIKAAEKIEKNTKEGVVGNVLRGYQEAIGTEFGISFGKSIKESTRANIGVDLEKRQRKTVDFITKPVGEALDNEAFRASAKRAGDTLGKNFRQVQYHLGDAIVAAIEKDANVLSRVKGFSDVLLDKDRIYKNTRRLGNDLNQVAKDFSSSLGDIDLATTAPFRFIDDSLREYRKAAIAERAIPRVRQRAAEIAQSSRRKNTGNVVDAETQELIIALGGYAGAKGLSGMRIPGLLKPYLREGQQAIGIRNVDQDRRRRELGEGFSGRTSRIAEALAKPNLRGFSLDALEAAANALVALERNPEIKIKVLGESGGGYLAEEVAEILRQFGVESSAIGVGTVELLGGLGTSKKIISGDEPLGQEAAIYRRFGLAKGGPLQNLIGVKEHPLDAYLNAMEANLEDFLEGPLEQLSKAGAQEILAGAKAFQGIDLSTRSARELEDTAGLAFDNLNLVKRHLMNASEDTVKDLEQAANIFESIYLEAESGDPGIKFVRDITKRAASMLDEMLEAPTLAAIAQAETIAQELEAVHEEFRSRYGRAPGTRGKQFETLDAELQRLRAAFGSPSLNISAPQQGGRQRTATTQGQPVQEDIGRTLRTKWVPEDLWAEPVAQVQMGGDDLAKELTEVAKGMADFRAAVTLTVEALHTNISQISDIFDPTEFRRRVVEAGTTARGLAEADPRRANQLMQNAVEAQEKFVADQRRLGELTEQAISQMAQMGRALSSAQRQITVAGNRDISVNPTEQINELRRAYQRQLKRAKAPNVEAGTRAQLAQGIIESEEQARGLASQYRELLPDDATAKKAIANLRRTLTQGVKSAQQIVGEFQATGAAIPEGLAEGINSQLSAIEETARRLGERVIEVAEDELDISSPSQVFERIGQQTVAGFEKGMENFRALVTSNPIGQFIDLIDDLAQQAAHADNPIGDLTRTIGQLLKTFLIFKATEFLSSQLLQLTDLSIQAALEMERFGTTLLFAEGSAGAAAAQLDDITESADRLGTAVRESIDTYAQLGAATRGTTLEGFASDQLAESVLTAASASALTADQLSRANIQIAQIASTGKLAGEELRSLAEIGGAFSGARGVGARALGIDPQELARQTRLGNILSEEFLPRFAIQLEAESLIAATDAADSAQASINRLENAIFEMQATVGQGLLPLEKLKTDVITSAIKFITDQMGNLLIIASFLTLLLAKETIISLALLGKNALLAATAHITLSGAMSAAIVAAKNLARQIGAIALQFVVFQAGIDLIGQLIQKSRDGAGELRKLADSGTASFEKLQDAIAAARNESAQLGQELPDTLRGNLLPGLLEENILFRLFPDEGVRRFENISRAIDNFSLRLLTGNEETFISKAESDAQDLAIAIDEILLKTSKLQSEALTQLGLTGEGAFELGRVREIDEQLRRLNSERRALRPGDTEGRRALDSEIEQLRREREAPGRVVATIQADLAKQLQILNAAISELEARRAGGSITAGQFQRQYAAASAEIENVQKLIDDFNGLIRESVDAVTLLGNAFQAVTLALRDANLQAEKQAALGRQGVAQARLGGATPGQIQSLQSAQQQAELNRQLQNNATAIQELTNLLQATAIQEALSVTGLGPNALPGEIEARALELPEESRERELLDLAAQYSGELAQLQTDTAGLQASILESQADARQAIIDFGRQLDDFYRGIAQQAEDLANETALIQNSTALQNAKSDLRESMLGFSRSFISGFTDQLMGLLDSLNEATRLDLEADAQIQQALRSFSDTSRQATELSRQAPGGAVGDGGTLVGITGNSGRSTGPHLDIRVRGGQRDLTQEELDRFRAGGRPITDFEMRSGFGSRIHPITGERKHHGGRDYAIATGTPITTTSPVKRINVRDPSKTGGGGWTTDVLFEDGLEVSILHQIPDIQSRVGQPTGGGRAQPGISQATNLIAGFEGFSPQAYWDYEQFTYGYGNRAPGAGATISEEDARAKLDQTVRSLQERILELATVPLSENQLAALTSLTFNIGEGAFADSTLLKQLNAGNLQGAADQFNRWTYAGGQVLPGLVNRREQERQLFLTPGGGANQPIDISQAQQATGAQLANIQSQTQAAVREAEVATQEQFQAIRDNFEQAMMTMGDSIRASARSFEDLQLALPEGPQAELQRNLLAITREEEDATRDLRQFIRQLEETAAQSEAGMTEIQNAIAAGRLPLEMGNELLASLQEFSQTSLSELEQAQMRAAEISELYQAQRDRLQAEFDRAAAERERAFQGRRLGGEVELAGLEGERLRRGGLPFDAIRLEQQMQRAQELLNFESAIAELEEMHRVGELSADQFETLTRLERELADARLQAIDVTEQAAIQEQRMREQSELFQSQAGLGEAIIGRRQGLGLGTGDLERQLAIAQEQQSLSQQLFDLDQLGLTAETTAQIRDNLIQISDLNMQSITDQFSVWGQVFPQIQTSATGLISGLLTNLDDIDGALESTFRNLQSYFADLAAQLAFQQILGLFGVGAGLPGLGGGIAGGSLFGLGAQKIPKLASGGLITGGVSGQDSVLAALMPGEFVLRPEDVQRFAAMGLLPSYAQGGYAPGSSPVMSKAGGAGGMMESYSPTINVTVNNNGDRADVQTQVQNAGKLGKVIEATTRQVIIRELGPRGLLSK